MSWTTIINGVKVLEQLVDKSNKSLLQCFENKHARETTVNGWEMFFLLNWIDAPEKIPHTHLRSQKSAFSQWNSNFYFSAHAYRGKRGKQSTNGVCKVFSFGEATNVNFTCTYRVLVWIVQWHKQTMCLVQTLNGNRLDMAKFRILFLCEETFVNKHWSYTQFWRGVMWHDMATLNHLCFSTIIFYD